MIGTPLIGLLQFYNIIVRINNKYCDNIFREQLALAMRAHSPAAVVIGKGEVNQECPISTANDFITSGENCAGTRTSP